MAKYADDNGLTHLSGLIITWVKGLLSSTNPLMDGTATPGTAKMLAREDHVHPTDTSRQETLVSGTNIKTIGSQSLLGSGNLTMANIGAAAASHAHGNITSGGDITATPPTIATGDKLIINDESASKVTNGPSFDTSDTAKYLRHDGTWESPPGTANQNAFSNVKVGSTTIAADTTTDTLEVVAGSNVTLTPDATNDKLTIAATDSHVLQHGEAGTNNNFQILFTGTPNQQSGAIDSVGFDSAKDFEYNPSTGNLTVTKINTYTLGAACEKSIGAVADNNSGLVTGDAVYDAIQSALGTMADALVYQGTIGAAADSPTVTSLPATHSKGDVYIVKTAGTYAGKGCEVGDMIICNTDGTTANNAHWDVIQSNIEALTNSEITTIWNNAVTANW